MFKRRLNLFTVASAIFWFIYTLILIFDLVKMSKLTPVDGELIAARESYRVTPGWKTYRPPHWDLYVIYTYKFNGTQYQGSRLRIEGNGMVFESFAVKKAVEMMADDKKITVWVNPRNPEFAVLERKIGLLAWLFWFFLIAITLLIYHVSPKVKN